MSEELVRPDPFYIRLEIANELERVATELRARRFDAPDRYSRSIIGQIAEVFDERASKIRGQLSAEADREAKDQEKSRNTWHRSASA